MAEAHQSVVVVGVDGPESSQHAGRWAAKRAEVTAAELVVMIAFDLPDMYSYISRGYGDDAREPRRRRSTPPRRSRSPPASWK